MAQATRYGFRSSLAGISGIQAGNLLFFAATALGLAALLEAANNTFTFIRWLGAIYLLYFGFRMIISASRQRPSNSLPGAAPAVRGKLFVQGLLIQITVG
jgi:threonine/homoserine/homoserine lactone efflux protein